jgi:hypothetical protein
VRRVGLVHKFSFKIQPPELSSRSTNTTSSLRILCTSARNHTLLPPLLQWAISGLQRATAGAQLSKREERLQVIDSSYKWVRRLFLRGIMIAPVVAPALVLVRIAWTVGSVGF